MRSMTVLWPDGPRTVDESTIRTWASDAYFNEAHHHLCSACRQRTTVEHAYCNHDGDSIPMYDPPRKRPVTLEECADFLDDMGLVTFATYKET